MPCIFGCVRSIICIKKETAHSNEPGHGGLRDHAVSGGCLRLNGFYPEAGGGGQLQAGSVLVLEESLPGGKQGAVAGKHPECDPLPAPGLSAPRGEGQTAGAGLGLLLRADGFGGHRGLPAGAEERTV